MPIMSRTPREDAMAAELKLVRTPAEEALVARLPQAGAGGPAPVVALRDIAREALTRRGLPNRRVEAWKYTDLRALMPEAAPLAQKPDAAHAAKVLAQAGALGGLGLATVTVVNGHVTGDLPAMPAGVTLTTLADAMAASHPLLAKLGAIEAVRANAAYALNSAFLRDGLVLHVAADAQTDAPLHVAFVNDADAPFATAPRILVVLEEGALFTLVESHRGKAGLAYQANTVTECVLGARASLTNVRLNAEGDKALALSTLTAVIGKEATLITVNVANGAAASRHQVYLEYAGEHAIANLNGVTMLGGARHADTTLHVDHAVAHGASRELYKTVVTGEATGVFQGKIVVRQRAQKTDGRMMSAALLLSEGATMNNKPELEIFADDVQCAHGATCGALDEDLLFYLMARGLPRAEAEALMIESFLGEAIEAVEHEELRAALAGQIAGWLARRD